MESDKDINSVEYEKLVRDIYQAIQDAYGTRVNVQHDVKIIGKSACEHQIDVYWEIEDAGDLRRFAIECKGYGRKVDLGRVRDFFAVLHDIGNLTGLMITKVGFTKGALKFANYYGIDLKEVRFPNTADWRGRVRKLVVDLAAYKSIVHGWKVAADTHWLLQTGKLKSESDSFSFSIRGAEDEVKVYGNDGEILTDLLQLKNELPFSFNEAKSLNHEFSFEDAYIETLESGRIKITSIGANYDIVAERTQLVINGEEQARAIHKDVNLGAINFFDKEGNLRG